MIAMRKVPECGFEAALAYIAPGTRNVRPDVDVE
jgi:hypothetical protein